METSDYIGLAARYKTAEGLTVRGVVVGWREDGRWLVGTHVQATPTCEVDPGDIRIEPREVPAAWQKVLDDNEDVEGIELVGVCYASRVGGRTTLYHRQNLGLLFYRLSEECSGDVTLGEGWDAPREGKPHLEETTTEYFVGDHTGEIQLQIEEVRYY